MGRCAAVAVVALAFAPSADGALVVSASVEQGAHAATFRWSSSDGE